MTCLNCCINFVIYCALYAAFQKELKSQVHKFGQKITKAWTLAKTIYFTSNKDSIGDSSLPPRSGDVSQRSRIIELQHIVDN